jgi:hypothetical protein
MNLVRRGRRAPTVFFLTIFLPSHFQTHLLFLFVAPIDFSLIDYHTIIDHPTLLYRTHRQPSR